MLVVFGWQLFEILLQQKLKTKNLKLNKNGSSS
jgi:hypothetical protein